MKKKNKDKLSIDSPVHKVIKYIEIQIQATNLTVADRRGFIQSVVLLLVVTIFIFSNRNFCIDLNLFMKRPKNVS